MKTAIFATAILAVLTASPAFAQTTQTAANTAPQVSQTASWTAPGQSYGEEKTRAQVRQELIHAEKDGQLAYLNQTLYSHG